ncbi:hypothetical protein StoSoilB13_26750 (plasmid) [Arthrobacter sp. StoSoilB13]|nr:hypothetical protein StoSoilB13_26750 [Arthrobacter sp. StoSoilB13]
MRGRVEYGRLGRCPADHGRTGGSSGISPRPSRITNATVPIAAAREAAPNKTRTTIKAIDIAMHL